MLEHFSGASSPNTEIIDIMSSSSVLEMLMMHGGDVKPEPGDHVIMADSSSSLWPPNEDHHHCNNNEFARILNYGSNASGFYHPHHHIPRTISCPPNMALIIESDNGREGLKKRKPAAAAAAEKSKISIKEVAEEGSQEKKMKGCVEEDKQLSKIRQQKSNCKSTATTTTTIDSNKENSKASEAPKTDYIHVRARRGQATDSHSLAERVRREKISERMRYLQDLVPGCNKVTGKAGMLDEIINYVQSLQKQVEFLSMKLAATNTPMEFDGDTYQGKEFYTANVVPTVGASSSSANSSHHHHHQLQVSELIMSEGIPCSNNMGVGMLNNPQDFTAALRRTTSAPVSALIPADSFLDSPCLNLPWDDDLHNLYSMELQQGRSTAFVPQPFAGFLDASHVKQEM